MAETATFKHNEAVPSVLLIPEMEADIETRARAARFIGSCLTKQEAEVTYAEEAQQLIPIESLHDAIQQAAEGSEPARTMIWTNAITDMAERALKSGHITKVTLSQDQAGRIQQNNQTMESVQANGIRRNYGDAIMQPRTEAEATNTFRIAECKRRGLFDDYNVVTISRPPEGETDEALSGIGFFTDTMSVSIQVTSAKGDELTLESAFVAGKRSPTAKRHDARAVAGLGHRLGVNLTDMSPTKLLDTPLLIHKNMMPNGVIDLVKMYDHALGDTFFGDQKPTQDYLEYREFCDERQDQLKPLAEWITDQLISEADSIHDRMDAVARLEQLSQDRMVDQAGYDDTINASVFGAAAAQIEEARAYIAVGDFMRAQESLHVAKRVAVSSSCPNGLKRNEAGSSEGDSESSEAASGELDDCVFVSKECPKCHKKNVLTTISKGKISGSCGCNAKLK